MAEQGSLATGISKGQARRSKPCYKEQEEKGKTASKQNDFGIEPQERTQAGTEAPD